MATESVLGGAGARNSSSAGAAAQGGAPRGQRRAACGRGGATFAKSPATPAGAALHCLRIVGDRGCVSAPGNAAFLGHVWGQRAPEAAAAPTHLWALLHGGAAPSMGMVIGSNVSGGAVRGGQRYTHKGALLRCAVHPPNESGVIPGAQLNPLCPCPRLARPLRRPKQPRSPYCRTAWRRCWSRAPRHDAAGGQGGRGGPCSRV